MTYNVSIWYRNGAQARHTCTDVVFSEEQWRNRPAGARLYFLNDSLPPKTLDYFDTRAIQVADPEGHTLDELDWSWENETAVNTRGKREKHDGGERGTEDTPRP